MYVYAEIVKPIAALLSDLDQGPFRMIIVDSVIALFRVEFNGRGELSERQQKVYYDIPYVDNGIKGALEYIMFGYS